MHKCIKALYYVLLLAISACQERKQTKDDTPDAVRDLLIDRSFWQKKATAHDKEINVHRLTITNTSHYYVYRHIEVRFDYYDRDHLKIDSSIRIVDREIEPRAAISVDRIESSQTKEGTAAATATIVTALAE